MSPARPSAIQSASRASRGMAVGAGDAAEIEPELGRAWP